MSRTEVSYLAAEAVSPGKIELTRKPLVDPQPGHVRICVGACGVCHTDAATVEGVLPIAWPRAPGHEAAGVIDRLGAGFLGGSCGRCGPDREALARKLGAHHYIDSVSTDPGQALQELGGAALVIATASGGKATAQVVKGLRPRGKVIALGVTDPIEVSTFDPLFGARSIEGALTGNPATGDAALKFSVLTGVAAMIETMPLEQAPEAYARMMAGKVRFRMVLTMQS